MPIEQSFRIVWSSGADASRQRQVKLQEIGLAYAKLHQAKADHQKWSKAAARPGLSPEAAAFAANAARSYAALVVLAQKALNYLAAPAKGEQRPESRGVRAAGEADRGAAGPARQDAPKRSAS